ncbi:MAG: pyridoxal phosphate-dependent aminotransferase, partial [Planctomycetota bacterium]
PNSPSGTWVAPEALAALAEGVDGILVVDEAYVDFADDDCTCLLGRFPNVIVLRSFSKSFSLAGVRLGYALADAAIIGGMVKVKDSYNVNRFAIAAGVAALEDVASMRANAAAIRRERERMAGELRALGLFVYPSQANFLALRTTAPSAEAVGAALEEEGILVRTFGDPLLSDWVRITIGTPDQNDQVLAGVRRLLEGVPS